jgi:transposase
MLSGNTAGGGRRRRKWTAAEKLRMVAETDAPGSSVSLVARRHDVNANLLFTWRRQAARGELGAAGGSVAPMGFIAVDVVTPGTDGRSAIMSGLAPAETGRHNRCGLIEITMLTGIVVRVDEAVDGQALHRVLLAVKSIS